MTLTLTPEEKQYWTDVIATTGAHRETMEQVRAIPEDYSAYLGKVVRETVIVPVPAVDVPVRCYVSTPKDKADNCPVFINMHGGGFVGPQNIDDDMFCAYVASEIRGIVVDIDYAVSYDHPFPVAFEQCYEVAKWAFGMCEKWGADPKRVSMGGHSSGGSLTAAVALKSVATGEFSLCSQILDYAPLDFYENEDNQRTVEPGSMPVLRSQAFTRLYINGDMPLTRLPYVSPVFATDDMLRGMPPALIITGGKCPFRDDDENFGLRMAAVGTEVTIKRFVNSRHGFTIRMVDEWREAQAQIVRYLRNTER